VRRRAELGAIGHDMGAARREPLRFVLCSKTIALNREMAEHTATAVNGDALMQRFEPGDGRVAQPSRRCARGAAALSRCRQTAPRVDS
jgi:hypothetical protein